MIGYQNRLFGTMVTMMNLQQQQQRQPSPSSLAPSTLWSENNDAYFERWNDRNKQQTGSSSPTWHSRERENNGVAQTIHSEPTKGISNKIITNTRPSQQQKSVPSMYPSFVQSAEVEAVQRSMQRSPTAGRPPLNSIPTLTSTTATNRSLSSVSRVPPPSNCTLTSELSLESAASVFCDIILPNSFARIADTNSKTMSVPQMTRLLHGHLQHATLQQNGKLWYYVRGSHVIDTLFELFYKDTPNVKEDEVIAFACHLVERHVLINWTPDCDEFALAFLVIYPLAQPNVLNTLFQWPRGQTANDPNEDSMSIMLRLSREMDELCQSEQQQDGNAVNQIVDISMSTNRFQSLEEQVCQLQAVTFPTDAKEHVTFALNLFNLIARHAMLVVSKRADWTWPTSLEEMQAFMQQIGYDIGGQIVTLAYLQDSLHGSKDEAAISLVARAPSFWASCRGGASSQPKDLHYEQSVIRTDCRILFATSWGCLSSPVASTIYPNRLNEGLRAASELYCQQQVVIQGRRVILPPILSWYRADFGTDPDKVVKAISRFLSPDQLESMVELNRQGVQVDVVFGEDFDWQPGVFCDTKTDAELFMSTVDDVPPTSTPCDDTTVAGHSLVSKASSFVSRVSKVVKSLPRLGRQVSEGDSQVKPLARKGGELGHSPAASPAGTMFRACYRNDDDDDNASRGPDTVVSALTLGSEFEEIRFRSMPRPKQSLQRLQQPSPTFSGSSIGT